MKLLLRCDHKWLMEVWRQSSLPDVIPAAQWFDPGHGLLSGLLLSIKQRRKHTGDQRTTARVQETGTVPKWQAQCSGVYPLWSLSGGREDSSEQAMLSSSTSQDAWPQAAARWIEVRPLESASRTEASCSTKHWVHSSWPHSSYGTGTKNKQRSPSAVVTREMVQSNYNWWNNLIYSKRSWHKRNKFSLSVLPQDAELWAPDDQPDGCRPPSPAVATRNRRVPLPPPATKGSCSRIDRTVRECLREGQTTPCKTVGLRRAQNSLSLGIGSVYEVCSVWFIQ